MNSKGVPMYIALIALLCAAPLAVGCSTASPLEGQRCSRSTKPQDTPARIELIGDGAQIRFSATLSGDAAAMITANIQQTPTTIQRESFEPYELPLARVRLDERIFDLRGLNLTQYEDGTLYVWPADVVTYRLTEVLLKQLDRRDGDDDIAQWIENAITTRRMPSATGRAPGADADIAVEAVGPVRVQLPLREPLVLKGESATVIRRIFKEQPVTRPVNPRLTAAPYGHVLIDEREVRMTGLAFDFRRGDVSLIYLSPVTYAFQEALKRNDLPHEQLVAHVSEVLLEANNLSRVSSRHRTADRVPTPDPPEGREPNPESRRQAGGGGNP